MLDALNENTLLPMGAALTVGGVVIGLVWRVSANVSEIRRDIKEIRTRLDNHWTRGDMLEWIMEADRANETVTFPLPKDHR